MSTENICVITESAHHFGDESLRRRCINNILRDPLPVLSHNSLAELCKECLIEIVKDETLPVGEEQIFEAVLRYAKTKCQMLGMADTAHNMQDVLGEAIKYIRFPIMDKDFFTEKVEPSELLQQTEILKLYRFFARNKQGDTGRFINRERRYLYTVKRFPNIESGFSYSRNKVDSISFTCSQDIMLKGFLVYGTDQGPSELEIKYHLVQEPYRGVLISKRINLNTDGAQKEYSVLFDEPRLLKQGKLYSLDMVINASTTFKGKNGMSEVTCETVVFTFSNSAKSSNTTCIDWGQIPGLVFGMPEAQESIESAV